MAENVTPKVTVLMPVFNGEKYLREAIESILNQNFKDFEFLIIDDGSTDDSADIIGSYADNRIRLISNETNRGLIYCLNLGLEQARGEYIARMDCDDISRPSRLKVQTTYLDHHPTVGVCGSFIKKFGAVNFVNRYYTRSADIKAEFLFHTGLAHPTVMLRKSLVKENHLRFDPDFIHAEDFDFWTKLSDFTDFANLPEVLLYYRVHGASISSTFSELQRSNVTRVKIRQLKKLGLMPTEHELFMHQSLKPIDKESAATFLRAEDSWHKSILAANETTRIYGLDSLQKIIRRRWLDICLANADNDQEIWRIFRRSDLGIGVLFSDPAASAKIFYRCFLNFRRN